MNSYYGQGNTEAERRGSFIQRPGPQVIVDVICKLHPAAIYRWISGACKNYGENLRAAMLTRKQADLPRVDLVAAAVLLFTFAYILLAINNVPVGRQPEFHFKNESGLITPLSSFFLAMASTFSIAALVVNLRTKERNIGLWLVMTLGFAFLSFDELIQFHERTGSVIRQHASSGIFRNWNDVIVIIYGFVALSVIGLLLPAIMRYRMVFEFFVAAFIFYIIHTFVDSTTASETTDSIILEESAKLLCVSLLALSMFVGFIGSLWNSGPLDKPKNGA